MGGGGGGLANDRTIKKFARTIIHPRVNFVPFSLLKCLDMYLSS